MNSFPRGCITARQCPACKVNLVCDSSGKAGSREGDTRYIQGPCCCMPVTCPECGHEPFGLDFTPGTPAISLTSLSLGGSEWATRAGAYREAEVCK